MKNLLRMVLIIGVLFFAPSVWTAEAGFSDEYNSGILDDRWTIVNPNPDSSVSLTGTALRVSASYQNGGSDYYGGSNYNAQRVLQAVSGDWTIETQMTFDPAGDYQGAGIFLCPDGEAVASTNCWRMAERAFYSGAGGQVIRSVGGYVGYTASVAYLKIQKFGMTYTGWYSSDGTNWILNGTYTDTVNRTITYAGLFVIRQPWNGAPVYSTVDFDYFHITETPCTPPPSGMVSWWGGDNNALDMVGTNNGTMMNGATYAPGMVGEAFSFDGVNDWVEVTGGVGDFGSDPFTVDFWMKSNNDGSSNPTFIMGKNYADAGIGWDIRLSNSMIQVVGVNGWGFNITSDASATPNVWHHIAVAATNSLVTLYVDGVVKGTSPRSPISSTANPFRIGFTTNFQSPAFNGLIDEVEFFNRALSQTEIQNIFYAGSAGKCRSCVTPPSNMVSWWDGEGDANDIIGTNHGTPQNGATFATGKVGQAFSFDGVNDSVVIPHNANQNMGSQMTIDAWVNLTTSGHGRSIVQKRSSSNVGGYIFETTHSPHGPDNGLVFCLWIGGAPNCVTTPANVLTLGTWQHVAAIYDGTNAKIHVDGVEKANALISGVIDTVTDPLSMGWNVVAPLFAWHGLIDEVEIFNRALSSSEIAAIYNAGSAGKCTQQQQYTLTVTKTGTGGGIVTATGIDCGVDCSETYTDGTVVTLTPTPEAGSIFSGWTGDPDCSDGQVTVDADKTCIARFTFAPNTLTVNLNPTEGGTVRGSGINCPSTICAQQYAPNANAVLTATSRNGYKFKNWTGCNIPAGSICTMTMNKSKTVTANFVGMYSISGKVVNQQGLPMPNVTVTLESIAGGGGQPPQVANTEALAADISRLVVTDAYGKYKFTKLPNGSYTVAPGDVGFTFTPLNQRVTIMDANQGGVNFKLVY